MTWTIEVDPITLAYIRIKTREEDQKGQSQRPAIRIGDKYRLMPSVTLQARGTDDEIVIRRTHKGKERWENGQKTLDHEMDDVRYNTKNGHYGFKTKKESVVVGSNEITVQIKPRSASSLTPQTDTWEEGKT